MNSQLCIGLFGFGVVGEGLYQVLQQTPSLKASIKKICIKDTAKKRNAPMHLFTTDKAELLHDQDIDVIVEVIDDADAAFQIVSAALQNGKHVVSASKKMIAHHLPELLQLQQQYQRSLLYESAACASIPVIRNLEEYYDNDLLQSISAIVNGSTNYILTRMFEEGLSFSDALKQAQLLGFAESNPALDIEGYDAVNKWSLLLAHAYGVVVHPNEILFNGIQQIDAADASYAAEMDCTIKLIAYAQKTKQDKVAAFVLPRFVHQSDVLGFVKNEFNGVVIASSFADKQFFYGKGAGSFPTASAVLSDIAALRYGYKYEYKKLKLSPSELDYDAILPVYLRYSTDTLVHISSWDDFTIITNTPAFNTAIGRVSIQTLLENDWWKQGNVSLIVLPDPVILSEHKVIYQDEVVYA